MQKRSYLHAAIVGMGLTILQAAPAQSEQCPGTGDVQDADCLYAQGLRAMDVDHDKALGTALLTQALAIREKQNPPPNTQEQAQQYLALADIYHALGRNGKAEPMYRHSLNILRNSVGPDHLDTVKVIDHLALVLMDMGRFVEAEPGLKHSVAIIEKAEGPNHPDLIAPLDKLAWICDSQHRTAEAAVYRRRIDAIKASGN